MYGPQSKKALRIIQRCLASPPDENDERTLDLTTVKNIFIVPPIPEGIHRVEIKGMKNVKSLTSIPSTLKCLDARGSSLTHLPESITTIEMRTLFIDETNVETLPRLPETLRKLSIDRCTKLKSIILPPRLENLYCRFTGLKEFPSLPDTVQFLEFASHGYPESSISTIYELSGVKLSERLPLPPLPPKLEYLKWYVREGDAWPSPDEWPESLVDLDLEGSQCSKIPSLPKNLQRLLLESTNIKELPTLPLTLYRLNAGQSLERIPLFHEGMRAFTFSSYSVKASDLPPIPSSMKHMRIVKKMYAEEDELLFEMDDGEIKKDTDGILEKQGFKKWSGPKFYLSMHFCVAPNCTCGRGFSL